MRIFILISIIFSFIISFLCSFIPLNLYKNTVISSLVDNASIIKKINPSQDISYPDIYISDINSIDKFQQIYNNFIKTKKNIYHNKNKLYYIDFMSSSNNNILILNKSFNVDYIVMHYTICIFFYILIVYALIFIILRMLFYKFVLLPLDEISSEVYKAYDKMQNISFKSYKLDILNNLCKKILHLECNTKNINSILEAEKIKISHILDNTEEGFILFDASKNVSMINKIAKKIFNVTNKQIGENIIHYTQNISIINGINNLFEKKHPRPFDIKTDDNKTYVVHINKIYKKAIGAYGVIFIRDVTPERENEKMKQEFFSNVSHEIKTPITAIQGYAELLYNDLVSSTEQEKKFLKIIQKESINVTNLINNILIISKLENREIEIDKSSINIKTVVDEILFSIESICILNSITVTNICDDITIVGDYKKIHQLFNNLIVNAVKYNKKNGSVEIDCYNQDRYTVIIVRDSGIGIPLIDRNRIFERFYRVEKGRSKALGGSGLGLSIVKHIVNYYNGKIKLKSTIGFGSEFIIKIPKNNF